jgi:hypothetical protein
MIASSVSGVWSRSRRASLLSIGDRLVISQPLVIRVNDRSAHIVAIHRWLDEWFKYDAS